MRDLFVSLFCTAMSFKLCSVGEKLSKKQKTVWNTVTFWRERATETEFHIQETSKATLRKIKSSGSTVKNCSHPWFPINNNFIWNTFKKLGSSESLMVDGRKKLIIKPSLWKLHGCNIKFTVKTGWRVAFSSCKNFANWESHTSSRQTTNLLLAAVNHYHDDSPLKAGCRRIFLRLWLHT